MSRITKTLRNNLLAAIIKDSKYADLEVDYKDAVKKVALEVLEKEFNGETAIKDYQATLDAFSGMPEALRRHMTMPKLNTSDGILDTAKWGSSVMSISFKPKGTQWSSNVYLHKGEMPVGMLYPNFLNLVAGKDSFFNSYAEKLLDAFEVIDENRKVRNEFSNKVCSLLMSVNTIPQLKKNLPQFVKYLPEDIKPVAKIKKVDIKEVLAELN